MRTEIVLLVYSISLPFSFFLFIRFASNPYKVETVESQAGNGNLYSILPAVTMMMMKIEFMFGNRFYFFVFCLSFSVVILQRRYTRSQDARQQADPRSSGNHSQGIHQVNFSYFIFWRSNSVN